MTRSFLYDYESQEANNYCREDFDTTAEKIDEFHELQIKIEEFKKTLLAFTKFFDNIGLFEQDKF